MANENKKKKIEPKTISISILLVLGIVIVAIGTILLLKGNNKGSSAGLEKILSNMENLKSYSVEYKITSGDTFTSEYLLDIDNEHHYTKYQFINRELVTSHFISYLDYNNEKEYYMSEFGNETLDIVPNRLAKVEDLFTRLSAGTLSNYSNGVYTIIMPKDEINKYNTEHDTMLKELQTIKGLDEVTNADVSYYVTIDNNRVTKINYKVDEYELTYVFNNYNNAGVTLPKTDSNGNITQEFVDEFRNNHPELINDTQYEEVPEVVE